MAFVSNETGQYEVFVQPFPEANRKWQISTQGGTGPIWSKNGRKLFYRQGNKMMMVPVSTSPRFIPGKPKVLFTGKFAEGWPPYANYDVTPDGSGFIMIEGEESSHPEPTRIHVILNWFEELRLRTAPPKSG